jgi:hypothetical protein
VVDVYISCSEGMTIVEDLNMLVVIKSRNIPSQHENDGEVNNLA